MKENVRWSGVVVAAVALLLPLKAGGCGRTACITVSKSALNQNGGACPAPSVAQTRLPDGTSCHGSATVAGPGFLDGEFCCYPVDLQDNSSGCSFGSGVVGTGGVGTGGVGGFGAVTTAVGVGGNGGIGGSGGSTGGCTTCQAVLNGAPPIQLCGNAASFYMDVMSCACSGPCAMACQASLCSTLGADSGCATCVENTAAGGCGPQVQSCAQN